MNCKTCNNRGTVWADLRRFKFGPGFMEFMTAGGANVKRTDSGDVFHEIVCPECNGESARETPATVPGKERP